MTRVPTTVPHHRLTRRQVLALGAAGAAVGAVRPGRAAAAGTESFAMPLPRPAATAAGWWTTATLAAPRPFDLVGLGWAPGAGAEAEVRARPCGGAWTRWTRLHVTGEHGPDTGGAAGTDPVWTGRADEFQLRVRGRPRGLRARFVRSAPPARRAPRRAALASSAGRRQTLAPAVIPRAAWGGDRVVPRSPAAFGQVQLAFVHHTATANDYGPEDSAAIVLGIARYHRDHNGWNDLGYNFLVDRYGQVFEGRAGGVEQAIVGAQAQGFNSVSTGIACLGTFTAEPQTGAAMAALAHLIGWKLSLHGVPVQGQVTVTSAGGPSNRFRSGTAVTFERVSGHRDGNATTCPGDALYGRLAELRDRAARHAGPPPGVSVRAASARLRGTTTVALSGTLRLPDGSPPAGAPIDVLYATAGSALSPVATAVCAADGSWRATVDLPRSGTVRARFRGDAARPPMESSSLEITILPRLSLAVSARRVRRGRSVVVRGVAWPSTSDRVLLTLERRVAGRYVRLRRRRVALRATRYARVLRPSRRGLYRITVAVDGAGAREYVRVI